MQLIVSPRCTGDGKNILYEINYKSFFIPHFVAYIYVQWTVRRAALALANPSIWLYAYDMGTVEKRFLVKCEHTVTKKCTNPMQCWFEAGKYLTWRYT
jgi:hypothetical protein